MFGACNFTIRSGPVFAVPVRSEIQWWPLVGTGFLLLGGMTCIEGTWGYLSV